MQYTESYWSKKKKYSQTILANLKAFFLLVSKLDSVELGGYAATF